MDCSIAPYFVLCSVSSFHGFRHMEMKEVLGEKIVIHILLTTMIDISNVCMFLASLMYCTVGYVEEHAMSLILQY